MTRPFADLRPTGLLWLINTTVFHQRGYALALHFNDDPDDDEAVGWSLVGDGAEPIDLPCPRCGGPVTIAHAAGVVLAVVCSTCRLIVDTPGTEPADE